jgi:branched-chain amino acid transport system substrate-binding protein
MRLIKLLFSVCLVLSIRVLLAGNLSEPRTYTSAISAVERGGSPDNSVSYVKSIMPPLGGGISHLRIPVARQYSGDQGIKRTIKIGLLVQNNNSREARNGAELAVMEANKKEEVNGITFGLVIRSMEGPWGTGSKQAVDLIFEEKVACIVGSHDGRNAHLVEQVATKARVVFLSAWSGDPTLSQAFVPWFFNCVPNDTQQTNFLIEEIYTKRKFRKIAIATDSSYDSVIALKSFLKRASASGMENPLIFTINNSDYGLNDQLNKLRKADVNCIVLLGQPEASTKFVQELRHRKMNLPVFGTLSVLGERDSSAHNSWEFEGAMVSTSGKWFLTDGSAFSRMYQNRFGVLPGAVAAYTYDSVNLIFEAIRAAGTDREKIQKFLLQIHYKGVTGEFNFDEKGNRNGALLLLDMKNGIPVEVEKQAPK